MDVLYFRPRKPGPEIFIENTVASQIPNLFPQTNHPMWTAGSLPIGAGMPDLVVVSFKPEIFALTQVPMPNEHILAYLRAVTRARLETIVKRVRRPRNEIMRSLNSLIEIEAVSKDTSTFSLSPNWRKILPDIISIEVKVKDWRKAIEQAARNCIFSNKSFIALPEKVAKRIKLEPIFNKSGVGLLSVDRNHEIRILRRARQKQPRVWAYYYKIATVTALNVKRGDNAIHCTHGNC